MGGGIEKGKRTIGGWFKIIYNFYDVYQMIYNTLIAVEKRGFNSAFLFHFSFYLLYNGPVFMQV